ncbi:MAG TPA: hypothetical protein VFU29_05510 [Chitinophagaceae bacterium]|nr:hypothetical protein [Chitinophagaceae bacterium]
MDLPDIQHLSPGDQQLVIQSQQKVLLEQDIKGFIAIEPFADVLDKVGMHQEARDYFQKIISSTTDILTQARCWRKIAFSCNNQKDFTNAGVAAQNALTLMRASLLKKKPEKDEYIRILHEASYSFYFQLKFEKLEATAKEVKRLLPDVTDIELRVNLFNIIGYSLITKYRWYMLPEEAFTHNELFLQLTSQLEDKFPYAVALCFAGHFYLWNEEISLSRKHFARAIQLLEGKHAGQLLIAYNYTTIGYRFQNNISMTEQWAHLTLEKAKQSSNLSYVPTSYANLAWVYANRKNWLYAEEYARKAKQAWSVTAFSYQYIFPLMHCLLQKKELNEAGQLAFKLLHPRLKKLPDTLTEKLRTVAKAWVGDNKIDLSNSLEDVIDEAKLTGYF